LTQFSSEGSITLSTGENVFVQKLGNRVADTLTDVVRQRLVNYQLHSCIGQGYPDHRLQPVKNDRSFAFELKAKTKFDPKDKNRETLTSGTTKLRRNFDMKKPICHLLTTVLYRRNRIGRRYKITVERLRLDFLEPGTRVQKRFEASVNPNLLSKGNHHVREIAPSQQKRGLKFWVRGKRGSRDYVASNR
jgi:hypothetical protein